jgi:hypothetical protein
VSELGRYASELNMLWTMTGAARGFHLVTWNDPVEGRQEHWIGVEELDRYVGLIDFLSRDMALEVEVSAVPRPQRGFGTAGLAHCLWVRTEGKKQLEKLARFRPRPTLVLEEGDSTRRIAFWALSEPLNYEWVIRANKRIAHALFAPKKWAEPEFMFNPPGSCLRDGRARPVLIRVAERNDELYSAKQVVGRLKDAPDPEAWRQAPGNVHGKAA